MCGTERTSGGAEAQNGGAAAVAGGGALAPTEEDRHGGGGGKRRRTDPPAHPAHTQPSHRRSNAVHKGGFFLTRLPTETGSPHTVTLAELLRLDMLESSVHFNFEIDLPWLVAQYPRGAQELPLLIVHGAQGSSGFCTRDAMPLVPTPARLMAFLSGCRSLTC
jgi:hypothetical protein